MASVLSEQHYMSGPPEGGLHRKFRTDAGRWLDGHRCVLELACIRRASSSVGSGFSRTF